MRISFNLFKYRCIVRSDTPKAASKKEQPILQIAALADSELQKIH
jgi:hypothetical protein